MSDLERVTARLADLVQSLEAQHVRSSEIGRAIKKGRRLGQMPFDEITAMWEHNAEAGAYSDAAWQIQLAFPEVFPEAARVEEDRLERIRRASEPKNLTVSFHDQVAIAVENAVRVGNAKFDALLERYAPLTWVQEALADLDMLVDDGEHQHLPGYEPGNPFDTGWPRGRWLKPDFANTYGIHRRKPSFYLPGR